MSGIDLEKIKEETIAALNELLEAASLKAGDILVLGCSTSEVSGGVIGKASNEEAGRTIVSALLSVLEPKGIFLAVQGCEHINRALVIEKESQEKYGFEEVSVVPALHAGGAASLAAYNLFKSPVMIEHVRAHAGIDIGDTEIGMHVKFVQVPVRLKTKYIGSARLTALKSRPKLIGGERAVYEKGL